MVVATILHKNKRCHSKSCWEERRLKYDSCIWIRVPIRECPKLNIHKYITEAKRWMGNVNNATTFFNWITLMDTEWSLYLLYLPKPTKITDFLYAVIFLQFTVNFEGLLNQSWRLHILTKFIYFYNNLCWFSIDCFVMPSQFLQVK